MYELEVANPVRLKTDTVTTWVSHSGHKKQLDPFDGQRLNPKSQNQPPHGSCLTTEHSSCSNTPTKVSALKSVFFCSTEGVPLAHTTCNPAVLPKGPGGGHDKVQWASYMETRSLDTGTTRKNNSQKASIQENYFSSVC